MATKIPTTTKTPTARRIAPPAPPAVAPLKDGCLKVRLSYLTSNPKHIRNLILNAVYSIKPPYNEDTCVLVPAEKCFNDFESYMGAFELLQQSGVLQADDTLVEATILIEDDLTLAYVVG
jgi:hypothetical protein